MPIRLDFALNSSQEITHFKTNESSGFDWKGLKTVVELLYSKMVLYSWQQMPTLRDDLYRW